MDLSGNKKWVVYGAVAVGVVVLWRMLAPSGGSSSTANTISAAGSAAASVTAATVADNQSAYAYMAHVADSAYNAQTSIMNAQTGGISAGFQSLTNAAVASAKVASDTASYASATAVGDYTARMWAQTQQNDSNNALTAFLADQQTQRQWQNIQLPLQSMWATTQLNAIVNTNATQQNIAQINASADVDINNAWANATTQQAKYAYKAALGQQGALGWGNLILGKSAAANVWGIKASTGSSSNSQGGTSQAHT